MGVFKADYAGIGKLLTSEFMQDEMLRRVEKAKEFAEVDAPFDPNDKDGDHYRDHFETESGVQHGKTDRAYGKLINDHVAAVSIEFGQKLQEPHNTPAHHTVARSIDAMRDL